MATLILSACGGSGAHKATPSWESVVGSGYRFQAPSGWKVQTVRGGRSASHGSNLVQVSTFPLAKPYTAALFGKVTIELRTRMDDLARQTGGAVAIMRTVTTTVGRAHAFDVTVDGHVDEYTFVLRGKREFLLLCRRPPGKTTDYCTQLVTSFAAAG